MHFAMDMSLGAQTHLTQRPAAPVITTESLDGGTNGVAYGATLAKTGAAGGTWSISSGALPSGLSLNASTGEISGTPDTVETANFTVRYTDPYGQSDTQALSIEIASASNAPPGYVEKGTFRFANNYGSGDTGGDLTAQSVQVAVNDYGYNPDTLEYIKFTFVSGDIVGFSRAQLGSTAAAISSATVWESYTPE